MSRLRHDDDEDSTLVTKVIEQGWFAFVLIAIFMVGLRLYNMRQRNSQRRLLREGLMAEMRYRSGKPSQKIE